MATIESDVSAVVRAITDAGIQSPEIADYGWPGSIESAVVDAVMSIRARYGSPTSGVLGSVHAYRRNLGSPGLDDLRHLAALGPERLAGVVGRQTSAGRAKSVLIPEVSARLVDAGVVRAMDVDPRLPAQRGAWSGTHGLGGVTWEYFTMLLGQPGVKADRMIRRFVSASVGRDVDSERAGVIVREVAEWLGADPRYLDHALWRHESGRPPR